MPDSAPLLTIAVPTYNRARELSLLLEYLAPQLAHFAEEVELLICDNASADDTQLRVRQWIDQGLRCRYELSPENLGPDSNFLRCYRLARGNFVWIFGDDDVIFDGALNRILAVLRQTNMDLVFVPSLGFVHHPTERTKPNPEASFRLFNSPKALLHALTFVGDLALISSVILNREWAERFSHADYELGRGSNLIQLGWTFHLLRHMRRAALFEQGLISTCEAAPSRPFDLVGVFAHNWKRQAERFLDARSPLHRSVLDAQMYAWFPANWVSMRRNGFAQHTAYPARQVFRDYGGRWTFWVFTWPLLFLPLPLAELWLVPIRMLRRLHREVLFRFFFTAVV